MYLEYSEVLYVVHLAHALSHVGCCSLSHVTYVLTCPIGYILVLVVVTLGMLSIQYFFFIDKMPLVTL